MSAERKRLVDAINRGGTVKHNGVRITTLAELPSEEELASVTGKAAMTARKTATAVKAKKADKPSSKPSSSPLDDDEEE